jgi:hypothetical protein
MAATAALPDLSSDVQDSAPTPEQSLRTTFATTPPRWPAPDGPSRPPPGRRPDPHPGAPTAPPTPGPRGRTPRRRTTSTPDRPRRNSSRRRAGRPSPVTSKDKNQDGTRARESTSKVTGKSTGVNKGKGVDQAPPPGPRPPPRRDPAVPLRGPHRQRRPDPRRRQLPPVRRHRQRAAPGPHPPAAGRPRVAFNAGTAAWLARPGDVLADPHDTDAGSADHGPGNRPSAGRAAGVAEPGPGPAGGGTRRQPTAPAAGARPAPGRPRRPVRDAGPGRCPTPRSTTDWPHYGIQGVTQAEDLDPVDLQTRYRTSHHGAQRTARTDRQPAEQPADVRLSAFDGRAADALTDMTPAERRWLLTAGYHRSTVPLTGEEARPARKRGAQLVERVGEPDRRHLPAACSPTPSTPRSTSSSRCRTRWPRPTPVPVAWRSTTRA